MTKLPTPVLDAPRARVRAARTAGGCAAIGCGAATPAMDPTVREKIANHPCYSQEAHHFYARMHVAVAPACNMQCNYCNRKFDCCNESRPGVTSRLLSPEQALAKVKVVANKVKQLKVLGIAGPGDPLANPKNTFRTLELVARECPDLKLCLSTNGLRLLEHIDRIVALGVDHVTVTINMIDPEVGERIYPWVVYGGRRYRGVEASRILSERQLAGLSALIERGVLCKVNSVMIPGINDEHLVDVSQLMKRMGAFIHNVMPLVVAPEHGTHFASTGQRGPTPRELKTLQDRCEGNGADMNMMRHCRQCRADAVGLLGEDRSAEFADDEVLGAEVGYDLQGRQAVHAEIERRREQMRSVRDELRLVTGGASRPERVVLLAVATKGGGVVNQHFGQAQEFWIYEAAPGWAKFVGTRSVDRFCQGPSECFEHESVLDRTVRALADCAAVLCSRVGPEPRHALAAAGIESVEVHDLIDKAVAEVGARHVGTPEPEAAAAS
ncbi:MAG: nitrogenase cofactor biosynthesis protein NifB [Solirubrobacteraceae bacterium]